MRSLRIPLDGLLSFETAYRQTQTLPKQTKADRNAEICKRYALGEKGMTLIFAYKKN